MAKSLNELAERQGFIKGKPDDTQNIDSMEVEKYEISDFSEVQAVFDRILVQLPLNNHKNYK